MGIIQDLGPTFVKIGQIASQQSEYIPPAYCDALATLRSSVAPMDLETVHAQIEKHLGKPTSELFASFDDKPLGSASIGQVHRAELFDGTVVAVKVRRSGVVDTVARDFALIEKLLDTFVKNGVELTDKQLEAVSGGSWKGDPYDCGHFGCGEYDCSCLSCGTVDCNSLDCTLY